MTAPAPLSLFSLGGATAALTGLLLRTRGLIPDIQCVAFGAPASVSDEISVLTQVRIAEPGGGKKAWNARVRTDRTVWNGMCVPCCARGMIVS